MVIPSIYRMVRKKRGLSGETAYSCLRDHNLPDPDGTDLTIFCSHARSAEQSDPDGGLPLKKRHKSDRRSPDINRSRYCCVLFGEICLGDVDVCPVISCWQPGMCRYHIVSGRDFYGTGPAGPCVSGDP